MKTRTIRKPVRTWLGVAVAVVLLHVGGVAQALTYTYSDIKSSCTSLTISPTGVITCHTGGANPIPFNFENQLSCSTGLDIDMTSGRVTCATTLPECTSLNASPSGAAASSGLVSVTGTPDADGNVAVTLTANCSSESKSYRWEEAGLYSQALGSQNTTTVPIPATPSPGYYEYAVKASNDIGYGSSASVNLKVTVPGKLGPFAYVPGNDKVSLLDTASNSATLNTLDIGAYPLGVAVHPRGSKAYVTNQGHNTVSVIDTVTNKVGSPVPIAPEGQGPAGVAVTPDGLKVYVANNKTDNVSVINALDDTVIGTVPLLANSKPMGVAAVEKADGSQLVFVANSGNDSVTVIDADKGEKGETVGAPIATGKAPHGIAATPDGAKVYVTNSGSDSFTVIDTSTSPYEAKGNTLGANAKKPQGVAVKPDGAEAYVVNQGSGTVSVIDTATDTVSATITGLGPMAYGVSFNADGSLAYVTNSGTGSNGSVSVINTARRTVVETIAIGGTPYGLGQFVGSASPYLGLWYKPGEDGWGMSLTQHGNMMFAAIYTYNQAGDPVWYVMSNCPVSGKGCMDKEIYEVTGGILPTAAWDGANLKVREAGTGTLSFDDADNGTFSFTIDGVDGSKAINRQQFGSGSTTPAVFYTDLWWGGKSESGWGVALTQQFDRIFATWYTYDAVGKPIWYVADNCAITGSGCKGALYRTAGGAPLTAPWNAAAYGGAVQVGTLEFSFTDAGTGTMTYTINGETGSKPITRQPF